MTHNDVKAFIADLARPFAIYAMALSAAFATVIVSQKVNTAEGGAMVLGAIGLTLTALYAGRVVENYKIAASSAAVEKIRAQASPPPEKALELATAEGSSDEPDPALYGGPRP